MGNTSSTAKQQPESPARSHPRRSRSLAPGNRSQSPASLVSPSPPPPLDASSQQTAQQPTTKHRLPHRSLRTKKKSIELPDLALTLTATNSATQSSSGTPGGGSNGASVNGPYRRPGASAPIAIPSSEQQAGGDGDGEGKGGALGVPVPNVPTAAFGTGANEGLPMAEAIVQSIVNTTGASGGRGKGRGRGTPNPHMRGAPLQYNSTRSFAGAFAEVSSGRAAPPPPQQQQEQQQQGGFASRGRTGGGGFVPEDIYSSIPLALRKAEEEVLDTVNDAGVSTDTSGASLSKISDGEERRLVPVYIVWRGGGKSVYLVRAGDDNWKAKQAMELDESTDTWTTWVSLPPGTHHIRFMVDGVVLTAQDLPTAVDDNGSLANYVAVPISGHTPPSTSNTIQPPEQMTPQQQYLPHQQAKSSGGASFFNDAAGGSSASLDGNSMPNDPALGGGNWTDKVPWQLECAAEEEEAWLAHGAGAGSSHRPTSSGNGGAAATPPPPQHPHAPQLPRHLEKLIMNQRNAPPPSSSSSAGGRHHSHRMFSGQSAQQQQQQQQPGQGQQQQPGHQQPSLGPRVPSMLPVTTASGTNLSGSVNRNANDSLSIPPSIAEAAPTHSQQSHQTSSHHHSSSSRHHQSYQHTVGSITAVADDGSVLPVPSHVVLHHLGTSAIRNGVLAVADTIRYRKKYITTIYYKPT